MNDIRDLYKMVTSLENEYDENAMQLNDSFDIELGETFVIETSIQGFTDDGVILESDAEMISFLEINDILLENDTIEENVKSLAAGIALIASMWGVNDHLAKKAYEASPQLQTLIQYYERAKEEGDSQNAKELERRIFQHKLRIDLGKGEVIGKDGSPIEPKYNSSEINEAEYQGRKVTLNKPSPNTDGKSKSKVYVKDPKTGNVRKITFGDPNMRIKKSNPERRKSFRARHKCDTAKDKTSARYWSCRAW